VKDPEPDHKCPERKAGKVGQDRAVFSRREVLTDIFKRQDRQTKVKVKI
jgi:hypothetical protein